MRTKKTSLKMKKMQLFSPSADGNGCTLKLQQVMQ